ncbi:MAG: hydrolase [Herbinix sp.]|jgi:8-oxo-dGTP diphosphatase|nr:hydrolase [Herbinix sp.]
MVLAENKSGWKLLDFLPIEENDLDQYSNITGAYAILKIKDNYVLGFNTWRNQWEFPAGHIEEGETPRYAAERELFEETHQKNSNLVFKGLVKISDTNDKIRYQAVYYCEQEELIEFIKKADDEMDKILLWDMVEDIGYIDEVDLKIVELCCAN